VKPALQLRLHQQLALTPQLQQAIRLLQLSSVELEMELREALESNPLLELSEIENEDGEDGEDAEFAGAESPVNGEPPAAETASSTDDSRDDQRREELNGDSSLDFEFSRNDYGSHASDDSDDYESQDQEPEDLRDHLLWQLNLSPLSPRDRAIGATIIEAIDDDGYLHETSETLRENLASLHHVSVEEVEAIRHRIQHFDPLGVASRTLSECLRAQLDVFDIATPGWAIARELVTHHLETLARNDRARLARQLHVGAAELDTAIALVRSLDPKPGAQINPGKAEYVAPDAYAFRRAGRWQVSLSPNCQPKLSINAHYTSLMARAQRDDASYLRGQLQEARWLIKSLQTRAETMLKVATAIVRSQTAFLDFGPEAMRPLVLRDIAEQIGMHESTVSRMTTRKYLHTPRGTFEFKYFFSSGVSTIDGGAASATAIQAMIRKLIDEEAPTRPMSDQALAVELNRRGIEVARRTVAKYREALHIASSNERSRFG
jgi:RNA polymerase sigma-54 factor